MQPPQPAATLGGDLSRLDADLRAFLDHWSNQRSAGEAIPDQATWTANLSPKFASALVRAEVLPDDVLIVFMGSDVAARRGETNEGRSLFSYNQRAKAPGVRIFHALCEQPCGYWVETLHPTTAGRWVRAHSVYLPLKQEPMRPPQIVGFSVEIDKRALNERMALMNRASEGAFVDVGRGVPEDQSMLKELT